MILNAYAVYDSKAMAYMQPIFYKTEGEALRAFSNACNLQEHPFHANAEDYTLFHLGDYDDESGMLAPFTTPKPLRKAIEMKGQIDG